MPCYHPLVAFDMGILPSGKKKLKVCPEYTDHLELVNGNWVPCSGDFVSRSAERVKQPLCKIPCGKCIGCKLDYSRMWANRCVLESKMHNSSIFLTLTYDDLCVPRVLYGDRENGEAREAMTLVKAHFQKFMKRLRSYVAYHIKDTFAGTVISIGESGPELRFFACGEYGPQTLRPHYHAIIFGLDLPDKQLLRNERGNPYYTSKIIGELWPYGQHIIGDVSMKSAAYVARYCTKKLSGSDADDAYDFYGIEHPFLLMSRKPGIGVPYYEKFLKGKKPDERIHVATPDGGLTFAWPRLFESKFDVDHHEDLALLKEDRKKALEETEIVRISLTDIDSRQLLHVEEDNKLSSLRKLSRNLPLPVDVKKLSLEKLRRLSNEKKS